MVKKTYLFIVITLLTGCSKLVDLKMKKAPYFGDELRIDGYYYSNPLYNKYADITTIGVAVFYRDGFCIHTWGESANPDTLSYIENEILLNDALITKMKKNPSHIGAFQIMYTDIKFETWELRNWVFTYYGKIVNDTTFIIHKRMENNTGKIFSENSTYRFHQFSPKPDSTNNFVK